MTEVLLLEGMPLVPFLPPKHLWLLVEVEPGKVEPPCPYCGTDLPQPTILSPALLKYTCPDCGLHFYHPVGWVYP